MAGRCPDSTSAATCALRTVRSILPHHASFGRLLAHLRVVVLDEGHAYHGVFGSHVGLVVRRLRRLCERQYGSSPRFVVTRCVFLWVQDVGDDLTGWILVALASAPGACTDAHLLRCCGVLAGIMCAHMFFCIWYHTCWLAFIPNTPPSM